MPVSEEMLRSLAEAGYRPISLYSYDQFIGGVRYVCLEPTWGVTQFTPIDHKSAWSIWTWEKDSATYENVSSRSQLYGLPVTNRQFFGKVSARVGFTIAPSVNPFKPGFSWPLFFDLFISKSIGGYDNPYLEYATSNFNARHPADPVAAAMNAVKLTQEQLKSREDAIRQKEAFMEVEKYKAWALECELAGELKKAGYFRSQAEEARKRVQDKLDWEANNMRRVSTRNMWTDPAITEYMKRLAETEVMQKARQDTSNLLADIEKEQKAQKKQRTKTKPKLETAVTGKRSIILDGDI